MAFDLGAMLIGYKASIKSNGAAMFHLYVWHHLLSILFWPVAILNNAFVFFVDWFVASEMSSPWLAVRGAMLTLGTINTPLGILVQLAFVATFFLGRIWVMPDLVLSLGSPTGPPSLRGRRTSPRAPFPSRSCSTYTGDS